MKEPFPDIGELDLLVTAQKQADAERLLELLEDGLRQTLALDRGGSCRGVAYRVARKKRAETIAYLRAIEPDDLERGAEQLPRHATQLAAEDLREHADLLGDHFIQEIYEIAGDASPAGNVVDVEVTASNCIQCGAISAKGGRLTPPEGGDGPEYTLM